MSDTVSKGACGYCGGFHMGMCPRIRSIEYWPDGTIKRVELYEIWPSASSGTARAAREEER